MATIAGGLKTGDLLLRIRDRLPWGVSPLFASAEGGVKMAEGIRWERCTASRVVFEGPCLFWGAVILTNTTGGDAEIYDGANATAGRYCIRLEGIAHQSTPVMWPKPLYFPSGLYVVIGTSTDEVVVGWEPEPPPEV